MSFLALGLDRSCAYAICHGLKTHEDITIMKIVVTKLESGETYECDSFYAASNRTDVPIFFIELMLKKRVSIDCLCGWHFTFVE